MQRSGINYPAENFRRLSGGANQESWLFDCGDETFVLRRAPSEEWMEGRALTFEQEAQVIRQARAHGVRAPEVVAELDPEDKLGSGFVMRCLAGTADPETVLAMPSALATEIAGAMAKIHSISPAKLPFLDILEPYDGVEKLYQQFVEAGSDRPIIALGIAWLRENLPPIAQLSLVHGDLRIGNIMCDRGHLTGVLDWELAHIGDSHEDLAYGCMAVWRFGRLEKVGLGLSDLETLIRAYEAAGGEAFDPTRFRFWLIYRTVWWALGCLEMGNAWRSNRDRSLERVVVARRTSEQELDLLLLLEDLAPEVERTRSIPPATLPLVPGNGEPSGAEILTAVSEWLNAEIKPLTSGRGKFDLAVARNALGIVARELDQRPVATDAVLAADLLTGKLGLATPGLLSRLRRMALDKLAADMPKYPVLAAARVKWEGN